MSKRTKGELKIVNERYLYAAGRRTMPICEVPQGCIRQSGVDKANAEYITLCWNNHDDLLAENRRMRKALEWWVEVNEGAPNKYKWAKQALNETV